MAARFGFLAAISVGSFAWSPASFAWSPASFAWTSTDARTTSDSISDTTGAPSTAIQVTDLLKIRQPGSITLSPDGKWIAFTLTDIVSDEDEADSYRYRTHLWLAPLDGAAPPRPLTSGEKGASQPAWHPSGTGLAFVRATDDGPQIFHLPLGGGEPIQLTSHKGGASSPAWSPDGTRLLFSTSVSHDDLLADSLFTEGPSWDVELAGRHVGDVPAGTKPNPDGTLDEIRSWLDRNESKGNPRVVNRLNMQGETGLNPVLRYSHVHLLEVPIVGGWVDPSFQPGSGIALTRGFFSFSGAAWSADGRSVFVQAALDSTTHPDRVDRSDLHAIDLVEEGGEWAAGRISLLHHDERFAAFAPLPSPDGRHLLFLGRDLDDRAYGQTRLFLLDLDSGEVTHLSEGFDRSLGSPAWHPNGRAIYFTANSNGGTPLYRIDVRNLRRGVQVERLTGYDSGIRSFDVGEEGLAYVLTEVVNPYELYAARHDATRPIALSTFNSSWLSDRILSQPERIVIDRPDGLQVEAWIMQPTFREPGRTYPLMLQIHGGPSAMWGPGEASMWHEFQYFAAQGYGIVYSNPRGSGGYGREFQAANFQDWGAGPAGDVLAAADVAAVLEWADPDRQVVTGGSYAGYLTAWIVGNDHRFKAAFAQRGVYELETFMGEGNAWRLIPTHFGGYPWEQGMREILDRESPQSYVDRIRTPLLIKHGDVDLRTGVIQSELLYKSLKILEKETEYVRYPRASHEMSRSGEPLQRMDRILRIHEFFSRYL